MTTPMPATTTTGFSHAIGDQMLEFIPGGPERLEALLRLIDGARHRLRIIVYMFEADHAGTAVRDALTRAARRGVDVALILDSFGSADTADGFFNPLVAAGGRYRWFGARWTPRYLIRNHLKLYIADDDVALFGGFNVADAYFAPLDAAEAWHDLGVAITGSEVAQLAARFDQLDGWLSAPRTSWRGLVRVLRAWDRSGGPLCWLAGGPSTRLSPWARAVTRDLERGGRLAMIMAYFSPGQSMLRRIGKLGRRGEARLILPAKSDNGATIGAARALYGFLLKRQVQVAEYTRARLHLKLLVIDDVTYVGSANFDLRSLFINLELMLRVEDAALADKVRGFIALHDAESEQLTLASHRARAGWFTRLRWGVAYFLVSIVDFGVTRRLNLGINRGD